jgi:CRP/FNR family transcriptional regulator
MPLQECEKLYSKIFPFWDKLNREDQELLCLHTSDAKYAKGENIHGSNRECTGGILVRKGSIRIYLLSEEGKEVTISRLYSGDTCMLGASCVLKSITFDVFMDATEDTECYIIDGPALAAVNKHSVYAENYALNIVVSRFSDVMWIMQQILFLSFDRRLAIFLHDEMSRTGSTTIHMTHDQIAKYMGSAREVVSRMLKYFAAEGIVEHSRGGIKIIDKKRLQALALNQ